VSLALIGGGGWKALNFHLSAPLTGPVNTVVIHALALLGSELESKAIGFLTIFERNKYVNAKRVLNGPWPRLDIAK